MLSACAVKADVCLRMIGGAPFLCFDADPLTPAQSLFLSRHSALYMTTVLEGGGLLRPVEPPSVCPLPQDLPEIQKYKGKTNASFTRLLINLCLSAGDRWNDLHPRILDPVCGRGTTLFCALCGGMDAVGIDTDAHEIQQAVQFTKKWLEYHRIGHSTEKTGWTLPGGRNAPVSVIRLKPDLQQTGQELTFIETDTCFAGALGRHIRADGLAADLPYGVQHAPHGTGKNQTLEQMLASALPGWREALKPGRAAAIAFNTYTLKRKLVEQLALSAGFILADADLYGDFSHWVEQAVSRDIVVAIRPKA